MSNSNENRRRRKKKGSRVTGNIHKKLQIDNDMGTDVQPVSKDKVNDTFDKTTDVGVINSTEPVVGDTFTATTGVKNGKDNVLIDNNRNIVSDPNSEAANNAKGDVFDGTKNARGPTSLVTELKASLVTDIQVANHDVGLGQFAHLVKLSPTIIINPVEISYGGINDIPIRVRIIEPDRYRKKLLINTDWMISKEWFKDIPSLIYNMFEWGRDIGDEYDFVLKDESINILSKTGGKRYVRNLLLTEEQNKSPISIAESLFDFRYDESLWDDIYTRGQTVSKREVLNVRINNTFMIDALSLEHYYLFCRSIGNLMAFNEMFRRGIYDREDELNKLNAFITNSWELPVRPDSFLEPKNINRSYVRNFEDKPDIIELVCQFVCLQNYYSNLLKNLWYKPLNDSARIAFSNTSPFLTVMNNSKNGLPTNRMTGYKNLVQSYSVKLAGDFLTVFESYFFDNRGYMQFSLNRDYVDFNKYAQIPDIFELLLILYFFKPQVVSKSHAEQLLIVFLSFIVIASGSDVPYVISVTSLLQQVNVGVIHPDLMNLVQVWVDYVEDMNPAYSDRDHRALYTNDGIFTTFNVAGNPMLVFDLSGKRYWGDRSSIQPFSKDFGNLTVDISLDLHRLLVLNNPGTVLRDYFAVMQDYVLGAMGAGNPKFMTSLACLYNYFTQIGTSVAFINRFEQWHRNEVHTVPRMSLYSFIVGVTKIDTTVIYYDYSSLVPKFNYDDLVLRQASYLMQRHKDVDQTVCNYSRITSLINEVYYKDHERWLMMKPIFKDTILGELMQDMNEPLDMLNLNIRSDGNHDDAYRFLEVIHRKYNSDYDTDPRSVFCCYNKAYDYILDTRNWLRMTYSDKFYICNAIDIPFEAGYRRKGRSIGRSVRYLDYFIDGPRFGTLEFKRILRNWIYDGDDICVRMPTFYEVKEVDRLSSNRSNFKCGTFTDPLDWLMTPIKRYSVDDIDLDVAFIIVEITNTRDIKYDTLTILFEQNTVVIEGRINYFLTPYDNDVDTILSPSLVTVDCILDELKDNTGEIYKSFPTDSSPPFMSTRTYT